MSVQGDRERYEADRRKDILLSATNGIDAALKANRLDALLFPGVSSADIGARPGYPTVTVPFGFVPVGRGTGASAFPEGFDPKPAPYNVSFTGTACSEPMLIRIAYAFEQATKKRHAAAGVPIGRGRRPIIPARRALPGCSRSPTAHGPRCRRG